MELLEAVKLLDLPDWWICAGFVRSKIWDTLHDFTHRTRLQDIDVIYFNPDNMLEEEEKRFEEMLNNLTSGIPWSVKNQARMHLRNHVAPYTSSVDAMTKFPETATALGVKLDQQHKLVLSAPHGIEDLIGLEVRPTPFFMLTQNRMQAYHKRIENKEWKAHWPKLTITHLKDI
ncbi:nucleotidyltransferase family protein [Planococcus soli]|uniref:nucleotidyltransferase family protein n=1 Tax=Planococcus soli TaxID=2666072 RepID=UPI001F21CDD2|nr:nucleotidyltransferase family protein [Planococcus soli]